MGGAINVDLGGGRGWLNEGPAKSIARIDREIGHLLQITEAGRTWAQQKKHWDTYQRNGWPIALHPDTPSIHQKGAAIDTDEGQRIHAVMTRHGWVRTVYRWVNGVWTLVEPWHYEYRWANDQHRNEMVRLARGADGVWRFANEPAPLPEPEPEEDIMIGTFTYVRSSDKRTVRVVHGEGFFEEHTDAKVKNGDVEASYGLKDRKWPSMPESYRDTVFNACMATRMGTAGKHRVP